MNGQKGTSTNHTKKNSTTAATTTTTSNSNLLDKENSALKTEVGQLKSKLDQMTKNIDDLTRMVQKVSLQQQEPTAPPLVMNQNHKRTKVDEAAMPPLPDMTHSYTKKMEVDDFAPPCIPSPMHPTLTDSEIPTDLSDDTFVDQLFTAFKTENFDFVEDSVMSQPQSPKTNRPGTGLMTKLSDALEVLPTQIQELIVNRLVQAITAPKEIQESLYTDDDKVLVPQSPSDNLPLAAATLAALLAQYGEDAIIKAAADHAKDSHKALLIPVHA
jgi:hypothetical protein